MLLAGLGGALGVAFAIWGIRFLTLLLANGRENFTLRAELELARAGCRGGALAVDGHAVRACSGAPVDAAGLVPALKESRTGEARGHGFRGLGLSRMLMVSQIAFTLLILVAAGLFVRTLSNLASIQLGFNRENLLTFQLNARQAGHSDPEIVAFYNDLRTQFSAIPGVRAASLSNHALIGTGTSGTGISVAGAASEDSSILTIGTGFFTTMQIPMLLGREIDERDRLGSPMVAVVNEAFARRGFGDRNPLGQHLACAAHVPEVRHRNRRGVSANTLYGNLKGKVPPTVYLPFAQGVWGPVQGMVYELRTAGNPLRTSVPCAIWFGGRTTPAAGRREEPESAGSTRRSTRRSRLPACAPPLRCLRWRSRALASTAPCPTTSPAGPARSASGWRSGRNAGGSCGWFFARCVSWRRQDSRSVCRQPLRRRELVESFLFEMKPNDPLALDGSVVTLVIAAILAGYLPARHASRIDPMTALRHE